MPLISIVMPTYNRADTIQRAIASIRAQSWSDWELIVVDDGSTDDTTSRLTGARPAHPPPAAGEPGCHRGPQHGAGRCQGRVGRVPRLRRRVAAAPPRPRSSVLCGAPGRAPLHERVLGRFRQRRVREALPPRGGRICAAHSQTHRLHGVRRPGPAGRPVPSLLSTSRTPVGPWGRPMLEKTPYADALHYRGNIFRGWRWEFLMSMQSTVLTRAALERVGMPDAKYKVASDYAWLALLCQAFTTNMVNAPGTIKHEYAAGKKRLAEGHLVTGKTALRFHQDMLQIFEDLFWKDAPGDPELCGHPCLQALQDRRGAALAGRAAALRSSTSKRPRRAIAGSTRRRLLWLARLVPQDQLAGRAFVASRRAVRLPAGVARRIRRATALPATPPRPRPAPGPRRADNAHAAGPALRAEDIEVKVVRSRAQLAPLFGELAALNLASRRPCPFSTPEFLSLTLEHDEFAAPGDELLFLLAYAGDRLVGYLPLRKTMRRALGMPIRAYREPLARLP